MAHPDVASEPEAINTIVKYNLIKNLGGGYTFSSLDEETFENIQLMNMCMNYEAKALESEQRKSDFYMEGV